jgi:hypothetical protein
VSVVSASGQTSVCRSLLNYANYHMTLWLIPEVAGLQNQSSGLQILPFLMYVS